MQISGVDLVTARAYCLDHMCRKGQFPKRLDAISFFSSKMNFNNLFYP